MNSSVRLVVLALLAVIVAGMWGLSVVSDRLDRASAAVAALDPRSFDRFSLVTVGSGGSFENPMRLGPALGVALGQDLALVDVGRGVTEALREARIPARQPRQIFLTALLPEDVVGLDDLWLTGWLGPRSAPLVVHGPPGTRALVQGLLAAEKGAAQAQRDAWELPAEGGRVEVDELRGGEVRKVGGIRVRAAALPGGPFPALAYRFEAQGHAFTIASVGFGRSALEQLARGSDLLAVGALYGAALDAAIRQGADRPQALRHEAALQYRIEDVGEVARAAGVRALVLTRLRPPPAFDFQYERLVHRTFRGGVQIAVDGDVITP